MVDEGNKRGGHGDPRADELEHEQRERIEWAREAARAWRRERTRRELKPVGCLMVLVIPSVILVATKASDADVSPALMSALLTAIMLLGIWLVVRR